MSSARPASGHGRDHLESRLAEVEELLSRLLAGEVDAIVGADGPLMIDLGDRRHQQSAALLDKMAHRLRELRCLNRVTKTLRTGVDVAGVLSEVVEVIPTGFSTPGEARCTIIFDGTTVSSKAEATGRLEPFAESDLVIGDDSRGSIALYSKPLETSPGSGQARGQRFIRAIADAVSQCLDRLLTETSLRQRSDELAAANTALANSRREALRVLADSSHQRKRAEAALTRLAKSEEELRRLADWGAGMQKAAEQLAACRTLREVIEVGARAPFEHLGMMASWIYIPEAGERQSRFAACTSGIDEIEAIDPSRCHHSATVITERQSVVSIHLSDEPAPPEPCRTCSLLRLQGDSHGISCGSFPVMEGKRCLAILNLHANLAPGESSPVEQARPLMETFCGHLSESWQRCRAMEQLAEAVQRAEAMSHAKSVFLANMSHEIRTPMNIILGFTELMLRGSTLEAEQKEHLETITRAGQHLLALINDVLEISKIESGRMELNNHTFDARQMLDDMAGFFRIRAEDRAVGLEFLCSPSVPQCIRADSGKMRQVLLNILGNAVKYTRRGQIVMRADVLSSLRPGSGDRHRSSKTISWQSRSSGTHEMLRQGPFLQIEISDTGAGISPEEAQRIFEPFYQTRNESGSREGTGLGLAIAKENLRLMGGELWVSSAPGLGSTFTFAVPIEPINPDEAAEPVKASISDNDAPIASLAPDQPPYSLVIADDDRDNRHLLRRLLETAGFKITEAADGNQAVRAVQHLRPDLVLMDINMPRLNGLEAIRRIRSWAGSLPPDEAGDPTSRTPSGSADGESSWPRIITVSARAFEEDRRLAIEAGADDHIRKPFRIDELLGVIGQQIGAVYSTLPGRAVRPAQTETRQETQTSSHQPVPRPADSTATPGLNAEPRVSAARHAVARLPTELRDRLREACASADLDRLQELIKLSEQYAPELAARLELHSRSFAYEQIERLLVEPEEPDRA